MANKTKTYRVTVTPPGSEQQTYTVVAASNMDAKAEASKLYYNHVFTGQFKYMRAKKVEISK